MTYVILSVAVLSALALVCVPTLRRLPFRPIALTAIALVALTAVFDNVIVGLHIVAYDDAKISGLLVPIAPIEDFAYALGAILLVPTVWTLLGRRKSKGVAE
jgi:lycopene cyclase domain-containing protein